MPDPTELLRGNGGPVEQRLVVGGYVSRNRPAPTTFEDTLWVILPEYSLDRLYGPCEWGALHGTTLPAQGARVVVVFDDRNIPVVIWWEGNSSPELMKALPASPVDGEEVYFQNAVMAEHGDVWHLRYRAASTSTHKWEFVGGSPIFYEGAGASVENKVSGEWVATNPSTFVTLPLAGDYEIYLQGWFLGVTSGATNFAQSLVTTAAPTVSLLSVRQQVTDTAGGSSQYNTLTTVSRLLGASAVAITPAVALSAGVYKYTVEAITMRVTPIRLG